jgi:RimJ/RimL family protein N-acetyltransferase
VPDAAAPVAGTAGEFRHLLCAVTPDDEAMLAHAEVEVIPEHDLGRIHAVVVAPELRGRGIAGALVEWLVAFAFADLALHRLELVRLSFNEPALRCYRRAGFTQEGARSPRLQGERWLLGPRVHGNARERASSTRVTVSG